MDFKKIVVSCFIIWLAQRSTSGLEISSDLPNFSTFLQSRNKRDDKYDVKCHQSGTGTYIICFLKIDTKMENNL